MTFFSIINITYKLMEQPRAPSYANLYLRKWEREALTQCPSNPPSTSVTMTTSAVTGLQAFPKTLQTKGYFKPAYTHAILHKSSHHLGHTLTGIIKSQIIRFYWISVNTSDFHNPTSTFPVSPLEVTPSTSVTRLKITIWPLLLPLRPPATIFSPPTTLPLTVPMSQSSFHPNLHIYHNPLTPSLRLTYPDPYAYAQP